MKKVISSILLLICLMFCVTAFTVQASEKAKDELGKIINDLNDLVSKADSLKVFTIISIIVLVIADAAIVIFTFIKRHRKDL